MTEDTPTTSAPTPAQSAAHHVAGEKPRPLPKRFYKAVSVATVGTPDAFQVLLDGRPIRTPAKRVLAVPTRALAEALAAEWQAQATVIDPTAMPLTRLVNTALDGVSGCEREVAADIAAYAGSDLLCYLALAPDDLVERQTALWGPIHDWLATELGVRPRLAHGVIHVAQDPALVAEFAAALRPCDAFQLAALHVMTTLTGSAMLALACLRRRLDVQTAWTLAHVDEDNQIARWGWDAEARRRRDARGVEMQAAARLLVLVTG